MMEVGRLCTKIAGRDAGQKCVIVDVLDKGFVMIDGLTRRRKCNVSHLEPLKDTIDIKKGASHEDVKAEFSKLGLSVRETKPKNAGAKPTQIRAEQRKKLAEAESKKVSKKTARAKKPEVPKPETPKAEVSKNDVNAEEKKEEAEAKKE